MTSLRAHRFAPGTLGWRVSRHQCSTRLAASRSRQLRRADGDDVAQVRRTAPAAGHGRDHRPTREVWRRRVPVLCQAPNVQIRGSSAGSAALRCSADKQTPHTSTPDCRILVTSHCRWFEQRVGAWWGRMQQRSLAECSAFTAYGITVYGEGPRSALEDAFQRTYDALVLLETHAPSIRAQITRDLSAIVIRSARIPAYYLSAGRICVLALRSTTTYPPAWVAAFIVHEAMHKRCMRGRLRNWPREWARVENICVAREMAFLDRLPDDPQHHVQQYREYRAAPIMTRSWRFGSRLRRVLAARAARVW